MALEFKKVISAEEIVPITINEYRDYDIPTEIERVGANKIHVALPLYEGETSTHTSSSGTPTHTVITYDEITIKDQTSGGVKLATAGKYLDKDIYVDTFPPTGSISITKPGTYNINQYSTANVSIPTETRTLNIDKNGTYTITPSAGRYITNVSISVNVIPQTGFELTPTGNWSYPWGPQYAYMQITKSDGTSFTWSEENLATEYAEGLITVLFTHEASAYDCTYTMNGVTTRIYENTPTQINVTAPITFYVDINCLTGDMKVTMADGSEKYIKDIELGEEILSFDFDTMKLIPNKVIFTDKDSQKMADSYDKWVFDNGTIVKTVSRHRLYNVEKQAMVYMDEWNIGEHTYCLDGTHPMLVSHEVVNEEVQHYKITGEQGTNYFVNGVLTGDRYCPSTIIL